MAIRALDRKMLRDLVHIWAQALAIALVMAGGVATLVLAFGAQNSLEEIRATYYERHRFADVFAEVTRAPNFVRRQLLAIDGVAAVETRISRFALIDVEGMAEPASGRALSLPDYRQTRVNQLYMKAGRLPEPGRFPLSEADECGKAFGCIPAADLGEGEGGGGEF